MKTHEPDTVKRNVIFIVITTAGENTCLGMYTTPDLVPHRHIKSGMVHTCSPSPEEIVAGGPEGQGKLSEFEAS